MPGMMQGSQTGGMPPMMTCTCPSALHGAGGIVLFALGAILTGAAAAALIALTVFLVRRSGQVPTT